MDAGSHRRQNGTTGDARRPRHHTFPPSVYMERSSRTRSVSGSTVPGQ